MGRQINWESINKRGGVVPKGLYAAEVESFEDGENRHGHLMYSLRLRITEPSEYAGSPLFDWFSVGTEEHPDDIVTSTFGAEKLLEFVTGCGVPLEQDDERLAASLANQVVIANVDVGKNQNDEPRNEVKGYFRRGERNPRVIATNATGATKGGPSIPRGARKSA